MKNDSTYKAAAREAAEFRFARSIAACLSASAETVAPDVAERLRFAREKSLEIARRAHRDQGVGVTASGAAIAGFSQSQWWLRFASVLPLVALVGGLVLIQDWQNRTQISVAAEVDEALLGDDLPITAYRDPGFSEFLKAPPNE
ncbi:MAG: DUF3619 family protein [Caldimonas sp.]